VIPASRSACCRLRPSPRGAAKRRSKLEVRTLNGQVAERIELPVPMWGRWVRDERYQLLGNSAWFVRNHRSAGCDENEAVAKHCLAVRLLLEGGEPVESVVPCLVDLFQRP